MSTVFRFRPSFNAALGHVASKTPGRNGEPTSADILSYWHYWHRWNPGEIHLLTLVPNGAHRFCCGSSSRAGNWSFRPIPTSWMTDLPHPWPRITWAHGAPRLLAPIPRRGAMAPAGAPCHWKKGMIQQISPLHHNLRLVLSRLWPIHMCYMVLNGFNSFFHILPPWFPMTFHNYLTSFPYFSWQVVGDDGFEAQHEVHICHSTCWGWALQYGLAPGLARYCWW